MKKGKVFTKSQLALAVMVLALGAAVWLNMKYSTNLETNDTTSKYLGDTQYVGNVSDSSAVETAGKVEEKDYFVTAKAEREKALKAAQEQIDETLKSQNATSEDKKEMQKKSAALADRIQAQTNIENLLKAKGFTEALAVISDDSVDIVVRSDGLLASETLQIQEIAVAQSGATLADIKIIPVK